jgi:histidinol dehydrogenase
MAPNVVAEAEVETNAEVMASVEEGPTETLVIADISCDDAYLTAPLADAATLPEWR